MFLHLETTSIHDHNFETRNFFVPDRSDYDHQKSIFGDRHFEVAHDNSVHARFVPHMPTPRNVFSLIDAFFFAMLQIEGLCALKYACAAF